MTKSKTQQSRERIALEAFQERHPAGSPQVAWAPPPLGEEISLEALRFHPKSEVGHYRGRVFFFVWRENSPPRIDCFEKPVSPRTKTALVGSIEWLDQDWSFTSSELRRVGD
ncbi:MAG: hypothetical protein ACLFUF_08605 [Opitutales bacterium]